MDSNLLLINAEDIFKADDYVHDVDEDDLNIDSESSCFEDNKQAKIREFLQNDESIRKFQQIFIHKNSLDLLDDGISSDKKIDRRSTFPASNQSSRISTYSFVGFIGRLSSRSNSVKKAPRTFQDINEDASSIESENSVFSDGLDDVGLLQQDLEVYKSASFCAQFPVFTKSNKQFLVRDDKNDCCLLDWQKNSLKLSEYTLKIFKPITREKHNQYQMMLLSHGGQAKGFTKFLLSQLHFQMEILNMNTSVYYNDKNFLSRNDYEMWKRHEKRKIEENLKLFSNSNCCEDVPEMEMSFIETNYVSEYVFLLQKIITFELEEKRNENTFSLLSHEALHLLSEFALRYRISELTQRVLYLQTLINYLDICEFTFLNEASYQYTIILEMLNSGDTFILKEDRRILLYTSEKIISKLKTKMTKLQSTWRPTTEEISHALSLIHSCHSLQQFFTSSFSSDYPSCLDSWFRISVVEEYLQKREKFLSDENKENKKIISPTTLYRLLVSSIASFYNHRGNNSKSLFARYLDEETASLIFCKQIMECAVKDLNQHLNIMISERSYLNITIILALPKKFEVLEKLIFKYNKHEKVKEDQKLNWKSVYHQILMQSFDQIETILRKLIIRCFINDTLVNIQALQLNPSSSTTLPPALNNENKCKNTKLFKSEAEQSLTSTVSSIKSCSLTDVSYISYKSNLKKTDRTDESSSTCSHSLIRFLVLINRFLSAISNTCSRIYTSDSEDVQTENVLAFNKQLAIIISSSINQYASVSMKQIFKILPKDLKISTLHQMENLSSQRRSNFYKNHEDITKKNKILSKIKLRINNLLILKNGLDHIWSLTSLTTKNSNLLKKKEIRRSFSEKNIPKNKLNKSFKRRTSLNENFLKPSFRKMMMSKVCLEDEISEDTTISSIRSQSQEDINVFNVIEDQVNQLLEQKITSTIEIYLFISIKRIHSKLRLVLQPSFFTNFQPSSSFSNTISSCENCFRVFTSTINRSLIRIKSCHSSARSRIWKRIWTDFVQSFCEQVDQLQIHRNRHPSLAFYLMILFRKTLQVFTKFHNKVPDMNNQILSTLSMLEIYLMPTYVVLNVLENLQHQDLITSFLTSKEIRYLIRKSKSFSGTQLISLLFNYKKGIEKDLTSTEEISDLCQSMLNANILQLNSVRRTITQLPSLLQFNMDDNLSNEENKSDISENESFPNVEIVEDENQFHCDENHFYIFTDLSNSSLSFSANDGSELKPEDLLNLIKVRAFNGDVEAKDYLKINYSDQCLHLRYFLNFFSLRCFKL